MPNTPRRRPRTPRSSAVCPLAPWLAASDPAPSCFRSSAASLSVSRDAVPLPIATSSTPCFFARPTRVRERLVPFPGRGVRVDRVGRDHFAGAVHHGDLHSGAQSRVEAQGGAVPGWGRQQDVAQVRGEDPHGFVLRGGEHPAAQIGGQPGEYPRAPGELRGLQQPGVGGPAAVGNAEEPGHRGFVPAACGGEGGVVVRFSLGEVQLQHAVLLAAQQRQDPVRGHPGRAAGRTRSSP